MPTRSLAKNSHGTFGLLQYVRLEIVGQFTENSTGKTRWMNERKKKKQLHWEKLNRSKLNTGKIRSIPKNNKLKSKQSNFSFTGTEFSVFFDFIFCWFVVQNLTAFYMENPMFALL